MGVGGWGGACCHLVHGVEHLILLAALVLFPAPSHHVVLLHDAVPGLLGLHGPIVAVQRRRRTGD